MELLPHAARRRTKMGTVVSDKMDKTVVVAVESLRRHRLYGRTMRRTTKYHAHDEENRCKIGDRVVIAESRPISRTKHWVVREVVGHDIVAALPKAADTDVTLQPERISPEEVPPTPERPRQAADVEEPVRGVADTDEE